MDVVDVDPDDEEGFRAWHGTLSAAYQADHPGEPTWQLVELAAQARGVGGESWLVPVAARDGDEVVGAGWLELSAADNLHLAWAYCAVAGGHRGRGAGAALVAALEDRARAEGRRVVTGWADERPDQVGRSVASAMLARRGYSLAQVNPRRDLRLPVDPARLDALEAQAAPFAGGYRVETFEGAWPEPWVGDRALFGLRMSTDAPRGALALEDERWDAGRVRRHEELLEAQDRRVLVAVAVEEASGSPVAFTEIVVPRGAPQRAYQEDTLVVDEHRGHRLGLLVKVANLRALMAVSPATAVVSTNNADDNRHMIAVNEALGCEVVTVEATWQKELDG